MEPISRDLTGRSTFENHARAIPIGEDSFTDFLQGILCLVENCVENFVARRMGEKNGCTMEILVMPLELLEVISPLRRWLGGPAPRCETIQTENNQNAADNSQGLEYLWHGAQSSHNSLMNTRNCSSQGEGVARIKREAVLSTRLRPVSKCLSSSLR